MAAASTIPAAKNALLAAIQARTALTTAGVLIERGLPVKLPSENERIYVNNARDIEREWADLGAQRLEESYTIEVVVECYKAGDYQTETEDRLWALVYEVELAVRSDLTLAGTVRIARPDGSQEDTFATDDGWVARTITRVACEARI